MSSSQKPPEIIHVCTKGSVASDFSSGVIFGNNGPSLKFGTVRYIRADVAEIPTDLKEQSDG